MRKRTLQSTLSITIAILTVASYFSLPVSANESDSTDDPGPAGESADSNLKTETGVTESEQCEKADIISVPSGEPVEEDADGSAKIENELMNDRAATTMTAARAVQTAEDLKAAAANASDGETLTLATDISYDQNVLGAITVSRNITLNFGDYKLTGIIPTDSKDIQSLFNVETGGSLTLVNAEISIGEGGTNGDVIGSNNGAVTVESTKGSGIQADDILDKNDGSLIIKSGTFTVADTIVEESNGSIEVFNGTFHSDNGYGFDDVSGTMIIHNANVETYMANIYLQGNGNASIRIENGTFTSYYSDCIDFNDNPNVKAEIVDGTFHADETAFDNLSGTLVIRYADVVTNGKCLYVGNNASADIYGGRYQAPDDCILNYGSVTMHAGSTFEASEDEDGCLYSRNGGTFVIAKDAYTFPEEWQAASRVEILSSVITIRYYSEGNMFYESKADISEQTFPSSAPANSHGYAFCFWETPDGRRIDNLSGIKVDTDLYAVFADRTYTITFKDRDTTSSEKVLVNTMLGKIPGIDRKDSGDNFRCWKMGDRIIDDSNTDPVCSDLTLTAIYGNMVTTYEELAAAVSRKDQAIELGADIPVTDTVTITYDCIIKGNGFGLIRPDDFTGILLSVENGITGGETSPDVSGEGPELSVNDARIDGRNVTAENPAVRAEKNTTLLMRDVIVENNYSQRNDDDIYGGGISIEDADATLTNCIVRNNNSSSNYWGGGGLYAHASYDASQKTLQLNGCTIERNSASSANGGGLYASNMNIVIDNSRIERNSAQNGGAFYFENSDHGSVRITNANIVDNTAEIEGGAIKSDTSIIHLYGNTRIANNHAKFGGGVESSSGDVTTSILYMHDQSSISNNTAEKGGGVYCDEIKIVMNDNSSIDHNQASGDGGGVYANCYGIDQEGGVIRDNVSGGKGGGVWISDQSNLTAGMIFDNRAAVSGDDVYNNYGLKQLYSSQADRNIGDGNSASLGTVFVKPIENYHPVTGEIMSVPWYGWFEDEETDRYKNISDSKLVSNDNSNMGILDGSITPADVKAIWYGLLLAYDANDGTGKNYQYDSRAYALNQSVTIPNTMFQRDGYIFAGWNTKQDGTGKAYAKDDQLVMTDSMVLYAQWEKSPEESPSTPTAATNTITAFPASNPNQNPISKTIPAPSRRLVPNTGAGREYKG